MQFAQSSMRDVFCGSGGAAIAAVKCQPHYLKGLAAYWHEGK
jgi:hypothetical protein